MKRKSVPTNGNHLRAIFGSMLPPAMLSRMSRNRVSTAVCTRLGRAVMRLAM
jgi:hypothetical protein